MKPNMFYTSRQSKYGAVKQNGYDSKKESAYAQELELRKRAKDIKDYKGQVKIELFGENGTRVCNYFVDFEVTHNDGSTEYVEVKGFETAIWRLKWRLFEDKFGKDHNIKLTIVR